MRALLAIFAAAMCSGCVMIVAYGPNATESCIYSHKQSATNMVIHEAVPISAKVADKLTGVTGVEASGNTITGIQGNTKVK